MYSGHWKVQCAHNRTCHIFDVNLSRELKKIEEWIYHLIYQLSCLFSFVNQHLYIHLEFSQIKLEAVSCSSRCCNLPVCGSVGTSSLLLGLDKTRPICYLHGQMALWSWPWWRSWSLVYWVCRQVSFIEVTSSNRCKYLFFLTVFIENNSMWNHLMN